MNKPLLYGACASLALSGCALLSRGEAMQVRYFTLEPAALKTTTTPARSEPLELRLGRIDASAALNQQLAVRSGENQIVYRDDERWTERPAQFVRRGLERELFQERGIIRAYAGAAPTLDVELVELELVTGAAPKARVRILAHLHDQRRGLCDETSAVEQPLNGPVSDQTSGETTPGSVASLSHALAQALERVAERTEQCLTAHATKPDQAQ